MNLFNLGVHYVKQEEAGDDGAAGGGSNGGAAGSGTGDEAANNGDQSLLGGAGEGGDGAGSPGSAEGAGGDDDGSEGAGSNQPWQLSDDVAGTGEAPEWFDSKKYKTVAEQAKAYPELASKLGGFTGAPEGDYDLAMPEDSPEGMGFAEDDPMLKGFQEIAREAGMSQEIFSKVIHFYANQELNGMQMNRDTELAALGDKASQRIADLETWGKANLDAEGYAALQAMATSAGSIGVIEQLISGRKAATIVPGSGDTPASGDTPEELRQLMADPKYQSDPVYQKKVAARFEKHYGTKPHKEIVG